MSTAIGASFAARVERHHPELPVYLLVPAEIVIGFGRDATFVVEASVAGRAIGRRSVKPWGDGRWFMELTKAQCDRLGVGEGDRVEVDLRPAPELPAELEAALAARDLEAAWARLSAAERRALAEDVFAAKRPDTRARRLQRALARLEQTS